ncbi:MAG: hypothetical protein K1X78_23660 [Verrucomicrobiaceae bacterium]|nr:hypothetical protein [Verrucomicrobiaceae bacterium]
MADDGANDSMAKECHRPSAATPTKRHQSPLKPAHNINKASGGLAMGRKGNAGQSPKRSTRRT